MSRGDGWDFSCGELEDEEEDDPEEKNWESTCVRAVPAVSTVSQVGAGWDLLEFRTRSSRRSWASSSKGELLPADPCVGAGMGNSCLRPPAVTSAAVDWTTSQEV